METRKAGYRVWSANRGMIWFMLLPAVGMAVVAIFVSDTARTDDGYPLRPFLLFFAGFWVLAQVVVLAVLRIVNMRKQELFTEGLDGKATILGVEETGTTINDMPVLRIRLRINDGYHPEYEMVHKETMPLTLIPKLMNSTEIAVKVDSSNPKRILLIL